MTLNALKYRIKGWYLLLKNIPEKGTKAGVIVAIAALVLSYKQFRESTQQARDNLKLARDQFELAQKQYRDAKIERNSDSTQNAKRDTATRHKAIIDSLLSAKKDLLQDEKDKTQLKINSQQLSVFKSQAGTADLQYKMQKKANEELYNQGKPIFLVENLVQDTSALKNGLKKTYVFDVKNHGKRSAFIISGTLVVWNEKKLFFEPRLSPMHADITNDMVFHITVDMYPDVKNDGNTNYLLQIKFMDVDKILQTSNLFFHINSTLGSFTTSDILHVDRLKFIKEIEFQEKRLGRFYSPL